MPEECDFKAKSFQEMKRHLRDSHGIVTGSTSPPNKKKKKLNLNDSTVNQGNENMDIESDVSNLSIQIEDMEIDVVETEGEEQEEKEKRKWMKKLIKCRKDMKKKKETEIKLQQK